MRIEDLDTDDIKEATQVSSFPADTPPIMVNYYKGIGDEDSVSQIKDFLAESDSSSPDDSTPVSISFDVTTTGNHYYDEFLSEHSAGYRAIRYKLSGTVELMTPEEYLHKSAELLGLADSQFLVGVDNSNVEHLSKVIESGGKLPIPILDYYNLVQDGSHRALACPKERLIPVLVVNRIDNIKDHLGLPDEFQLSEDSILSYYDSKGVLRRFYTNYNITKTIELTDKLLNEE